MTPRGGKREGAGAKKQAPPEAKRHTLLLTPAELEQVKALILKLRGGKDNG